MLVEINPEQALIGVLSNNRHFIDSNYEFNKNCSEEPVTGTAENQTHFKAVN